MDPISIPLPLTVTSSMVPCIKLFLSLACLSPSLTIVTVSYGYMIQRKKTDCGRRTAASSTVLCTSFASLAVFSCSITLLYYGPRCHWILSSRESPLTVCLHSLSLLYACYCVIVVSLACYRVSIVIPHIVFSNRESTTLHRYKSSEYNRFCRINGADGKISS